MELKNPELWQKCRRLSHSVFFAVVEDWAERMEEAMRAERSLDRKLARETMETVYHDAGQPAFTDGNDDAAAAACLFAAWRYGTELRQILPHPDLICRQDPSQFDLAGWIHQKERHRAAYRGRCRQALIAARSAVEEKGEGWIVERPEIIPGVGLSRVIVEMKPGGDSVGALAITSWSLKSGQSVKLLKVRLPHQFYEPEGDAAFDEFHWAVPLEY